MRNQTAVDLYMVGRPYFGECDKCHSETTVTPFAEPFEDSGEWDYCAACVDAIPINPIE